MTQQHHTGAEPAAHTDLFLEFVNTLELEGGVPVDHVADGASLGTWLADHTVCDRASASRLQRAMPQFRELRTLIRDVVERLADGRRPTTAQVRRLNEELRGGLHYHQLRSGAGGARYTIGQVGDDVELLRATIAGSLAQYLAHDDARRLRVCANDGCRWLFVDRSPAGRRRWCDMRVCGNRAKVARHRARARTERRGATDRSVPDRRSPAG
jgi:predicted RNA-binding Zn ribbon-like protein